VAVVGIAVALAAIGLVGAGSAEPVLAATDEPVVSHATPARGARALAAPSRRRSALGELAMATAAGVGFGLFAVGVQRAGDDAGLWPLIAGRAASVSGFAVAVVVIGQRAVATGPVRLLVVATAVADTGANALYLLAAGRGLLSIVGAVVALYPATTVILARVLLGERLARCQQLGLVAAAVAVILVASR
jgi:drug/metabolite transporter (DMT)-like permease